MLFSMCFVYRLLCVFVNGCVCVCAGIAVCVGRTQIVVVCACVRVCIVHGLYFRTHKRQHTHTPVLCLSAPCVGPALTSDLVSPPGLEGAEDGGVRPVRRLHRRADDHPMHQRGSQAHRNPPPHTRTHTHPQEKRSVPGGAAGGWVHHPDSPATDR